MNENNETLETTSQQNLSDKSPIRGVDLNKKLITTIAIGILGVGYVLTLIFGGNDKKKEEDLVKLDKPNLEQLQGENKNQSNPLMLPENYNEDTKNENQQMETNTAGMEGESYFSDNYKDASLDEDAIQYDTQYKDYSYRQGNNNSNYNDNYQQQLEEKARAEEERKKAILESRNSKIGFLQKESNSNNLDLSNLTGTSNNSAQQSQTQEDYYKALNQQSNKKSFANTTNSESNWYLKGNLQNVYSKYEVKAGSIIPATLITQLNSDLPGYATAVVRESVYDTVNGKYLLIPKGAKLIGEYSSEVTFAQDRVMVVWQRLIMPNGKSLNLENMGGVDLTGMTGLKDKVSNHTLKLFQGVILSAMIGGSTDSTKDSSNATVYAQESASTVAENYVEKFLNVQPTIIIRQGTKFNVFVNKDMILEPYKEK